MASQATTSSSGESRPLEPKPPPTFGGDHPHGPGIEAKAVCQLVAGHVDPLAGRVESEAMAIPGGRAHPALHREWRHAVIDDPLAYHHIGSCVEIGGQRRPVGADHVGADLGEQQHVPGHRFLHPDQRGQSLVVHFYQRRRVRRFVGVAGNHRSQGFAHEPDPAAGQRPPGEASVRSGNNAGGAAAPTPAPRP